MEQQRKGEGDTRLSLATRNFLFRMLPFLDSKLPGCLAIHSFVYGALLTADSSYRVYFRRRHDSAKNAEVDDISIIVGIKEETFFDSTNNRSRKCWTLIPWAAEDDEMIVGAYNDIDVINWTYDAIIIHYDRHAPHPAIADFLLSKQEPGTKPNACYPCDQYVLSRSAALDLQLGEMDDVYVKSLERRHAQMVYDHWPYKESTRVEHLADEIQQLPSAGLFLKENDQLVSWLMCHLPNGMSRLHTLEQHRRKGYAALVTKYLSKRMAQCGFVPFVNIHLGNTASLKFFESIGFQLLGAGHVYEMRTM